MQRISVISFTENGNCLARKVQNCFKDWDIQCFTKEKIKEQGLTGWTKEQMRQKHALLFIGACGIAVRAIAPNLMDKLQDSPVLVMDEKGNYVIPVLSGHVGGANELACLLAEGIGAVPVITTATDINGKFAVDVFAKKNGLWIHNKEGIARVSSKVLRGERITLSVEAGRIINTKLPDEIEVVPYPPEEPVDVLITADSIVCDALLTLKPKEYVLGMGCKKGKEEEKIRKFISKVLDREGIFKEQIYALSSVEQKAEESGFLGWSRKERIPFVTYSAEELNQVEGSFTGSDFVKRTIGVDNVCERAALRACENGGTLIVRKEAEDGMTLAIAKRDWRICLDEV